MSKPLTPAAQAVLDAYIVGLSSLSSTRRWRRLALAAALKALAGQDETLFDENEELMPGVRAVRTDRILAIATELEAP